MQDAVCVDVEGNFDLRRAPRGWRDAVKVKGAEVLVVAREWALTLQHLDLHARLVVAVGRKDLRLAGWDGSVTRNHRRSHAARGFNRESKRSYVEQQHVFNVSLEHATLDGGANRHDFVGVYAFMRLLAD